MMTLLKIITHVANVNIYRKTGIVHVCYWIWTCSTIFVFLGTVVLLASTTSFSVIGTANCSSMNKCGSICCSFLLFVQFKFVTYFQNNDSIAHVFSMTSTSAEIVAKAHYGVSTFSFIEVVVTRPSNPKSPASLKTAGFVAIMNALCLNRTQYHGNTQCRRTRSTII